ncbi:MAG: GNAT family N-acetyltransferase [Actinomycetota bacterium]
MIDPHVVVVDPADTHLIEQLPALERAARAALIDQRGGGPWLVEHPEVADRWRQRAAEADVLAAMIDDVVVGYMVAIDDAPDGVEPILRIDQVWVTPEARELGFGDELLALAMERGRARGMAAVEGQALPGDRHTKNLYERAGIVARLITTYRPL